MKTRAAVMYEHNQPVVVEDLELEEPKANEVLVRTAASGVCHSDLSVVTGAIYYDAAVVLGHEGAGIIEHVGKDVTGFRVGDHVILSFVTYCSDCRMCRMEKVCLCETYDVPRGFQLDGTYRLYNKSGQGILQMARIATMAEYMVVPQQNLVKIDDHYSLEKAALVGCGVTTGIGAVLNTAKVEPGSSVAVIGTGGVGLNAIQGAVLAKAEKIIAVDIAEKKLDFAKGFGATHAVNATDNDPVEAVRELTEGRGVDYAFEVIGNPDTIVQAYRMVRAAGTAVIVGMAHHEKEFSIPAQHFVATERQIIGSFYGSCQPRVDMPKLLNLYTEGKLKLDELITKHYRLDQINEAFADMEAGENARGVITFN
ncbi:MAG: Zn-dependent alcohol dehydrogenase [Candidatus Poribacteria bacterium]|nr:Zn-dependent alcohol dehydrogenase [Candidatus Poribacteria bacterium]